MGKHSLLPVDRVNSDCGKRVNGKRKKGEWEKGKGLEVGEGIDAFDLLVSRGFYEDEIARFNAV